jgi:hypothetical protein
MIFSSSFNRTYPGSSFRIEGDTVIVGQGVRLLVPGDIDNAENLWKALIDQRETSGDIEYE